MRSFLAGVCILAVGILQEPSVVPVVVTTRDGHRLAGPAELRPLKVESTVGTVEVAIKDIKAIRFEQKSATVETLDGSRIRGTITFDSVSVKCPLGEIKVKRDNLASIEGISSSAQGGGINQWSTSYEIVALTRDGSEIVGTTDSERLRIETTLGTFDIDIRTIMLLSTDGDKWMVNLLGGTQVGLKPGFESLKIRSKVGDFTIKTDNLQRLVVREARRMPLPPQAPPAPAAPEPGPPPAAKFEAKADVKAVLSRFLLSADGKRVYAINASEAKLMAWFLPTLEKSGEIPLSGPERAIALAPSGTRLFAVGKGRVSVFDTVDMKKLQSFDVEHDLFDVHALGDQQVLATSNDRSVIISVPKTAVIRRIQGPYGFLRYVPEAGRVIVDAGHFALSKGGENDEVRYFGGHSNQPEPFEVSPDGRYLVMPDGQVVRLGRSPDALKVNLTKVDRHLAATFSTDSKLLYVFTDLGFVRAYDTLNFEIVTSKSLGLRVYQAAVAPSGSSFVVAAWPSYSKSEQRPRSTELGLTPSPVDLFRIEIPK